ncbi:MAG TPA: GtrA family protein [Dermatophilaceae bacterium]|nr:GtrA family protein [Dermatophilaceae bacterium]
MSPETAPPAGMSGPPGWFPRVVRDQRVAFLIVGGINTVVGFLCFAGFLVVLGKQRYLVALVCAHVVAVLIAFVLYRFAVFRVRGHVLADLWRFETVYLSALAVNFVVLPVLVELAHLPVLLAQALIVLVTSVMSWVGHKHFSFRRPTSSGDLRR